ncbi:hypothetical protein NQ317_004225 [Molorchus minor]|uniref:SIAH-type domain-containing protein n=1 Tax=Molorchus minor TaxID=1323400 RepID=A0ABQ9JMP8_9CUCU|nr:hypothetical protein NQ317_004225 [Molorchus minor]
MAFILSDESLNKLVCSSCEKYLSVKPVKIYSNGLTKCGRCVSNEDDGVISFFGLVAENALFPCINRYEGCQRYLQYSEVSDHEINCEARRYLCPLCPSHIYQPAPAYQFPNHYKRHHAKEILIQPEFFIDINEECEKNLFYCKNNCIYIINVRRYLNEKNLLLNASVLGSKERCKSIKQKICLYTIDKELLVETREKSCSTLDNNSNAFKIPLSTLITNLSPFYHLLI